MSARLEWIHNENRKGSGNMVLLQCLHEGYEGFVLAANMPKKK